MEYTKSTTGAWVDSDTIGGKKVQIINEVEKRESSFKDKDGEAKIENVGKVRVEGSDEVLNMRFNWTTIYGLIDAYGKDSKDWIGKTLVAKTIDAMVGDTMRTIVYLVPEGFELAKNAEKKMEIRKIKDVEEINPEEIPF